MSRWEKVALVGLKERVGGLQVFYVPEREAVDGPQHSGVTFEIWARPELYVRHQPSPPEGAGCEDELSDREETLPLLGDDDIPF